MVGDEVPAVVVAEREAAGGAGGDLAELRADDHGERLGRLEAGAALRHVPAHELGVPVLRDAEDPDLAVLDGSNLERYPIRLKRPAMYRSHSLRRRSSAGILSD